MKPNWTSWWTSWSDKDTEAVAAEIREGLQHRPSVFMATVAHGLREGHLKIVPAAEEGQPADLNMSTSSPVGLESRSTEYQRKPPVSRDIPPESDPRVVPVWLALLVVFLAVVLPFILIYVLPESWFQYLDNVNGTPVWPWGRS